MAGVSRGTIGRWLREGRLKRVGLLHRRSGAGNRNLTLVSRLEVAEKLTHSKKGLPIFYSIHPDHVTIDEAAEIAGVARGTIGRWPQEGRLKRVGILRRRSSGESGYRPRQPV